MTDTDLSIHDLVRVRLENAPDWLVRGIRARLGHFAVSPNDRPAVDVRLIPMSRGARPVPVWSFSGARHRLACAVYEGQAGVLLLHREKADVGIFPDECIDIAYGPRPRAIRRIYGMLLLAVRLAMRRKGGLLFHGSCLAGSSGPVLIAGPRGAGKTLLGLMLMRDGWACLADDKLLLSSGLALPLETTVRVRDHHIRRLPWLRECLPAPARRRQSAIRRTARRLVAALGMGLPGKLLARRWRDRWNGVSVVGVRDLFPGTKPLEVAQPHAWVHLRSAQELGWRPLSEADMVARMGAIQRMFFQDMAPLEELLTSFCGFAAPSLEEILAAHTRDRTLIEFDLPIDGDLEQTKGAFEQCLQQR